MIAERRKGQKVNLEREALGRPTLPAFDNDEKITSPNPKSDSCIFDVPFKLQEGSKLLAKVFEVGRKIAGTDEDPGISTRWSSSNGYTNSSAVKNGDNAVQHVLPQAQGSAELEPLFDFIMKQAGAIEDLGVPSLKEAMSKSVLGGYTGTFVRHWFEPDLLASLRLITVGMLRVFLANPANLKAALGGDSSLATIEGLPVAHGSEPLTITQFGLVMRGMEKTLAMALAKNIACPIYHSTISKGERLYMPPGWLVSSTAGNGKPTAGVRRCFMPVVSTHALSALKGDGDSAADDHVADIAKCVDVLLNLVSSQTS